MDRHWLLSNTCYGNRLPGDARGFVGRVWEHRPLDPAELPRVTHNGAGTPCDAGLPGLEAASRERMRGPAIRLTVAEAEVLLEQFMETARFRGWSIRAVAIMSDHFHIVVGVPGDPSPSKILGDFKSWGTRRLDQRFGPRASGTWWTEGGSKWKLPDERAIVGAVLYVLYEQPDPLITWSPETGLHHGLPPLPTASVEA